MDANNFYQPWSIAEPVSSAVGAVGHSCVATSGNAYFTVVYEVTWSVDGIALTYATTVSTVAPAVSGAPYLARQPDARVEFAS